MNHLRSGGFSFVILWLGLVASPAWGQPLWPILPPTTVISENEVPPNDTFGAANLSKKRAFKWRMGFC